MEASGTIPDQKSRSAVSHDGIERRHDGSDLLEARHANEDQYGIRYGANETDRKYMLIPQSLPQHEGVLRANSNNQAEAHGKAGDVDGRIHEWSPFESKLALG